MVRQFSGDELVSQICEADVDCVRMVPLRALPIRGDRFRVQGPDERIAGFSIQAGDIPAPEGGSTAGGPADKYDVDWLSAMRPGEARAHTKTRGTPRQTQRPTLQSAVLDGDHAAPFDLEDALAAILCLDERAKKSLRTSAEDAAEAVRVDEEDEIELAEASAAEAGPSTGTPAPLAVSDAEAVGNIERISDSFPRMRYQWCLFEPGCIIRVGALAIYKQAWGISLKTSPSRRPVPPVLLRRLPWQKSLHQRPWRQRLRLCPMSMKLAMCALRFRCASPRAGKCRK